MTDPTRPDIRHPAGDTRRHMAHIPRVTGPIGGDTGGERLGDGGDTPGSLSDR